MSLMELTAPAALLSKGQNYPDRMGTGPRGGFFSSGLLDCVRDQHAKNGQRDQRERSKKHPHTALVYSSSVASKSTFASLTASVGSIPVTRPP